MAAFTALALGLLGAAVASKLAGGGNKDDASTNGDQRLHAANPAAPAQTTLGTDATTALTPPDTTATDAAAIPQAQTAANRAAKRAAAGDTILTGKPSTGKAATATTQPVTLLGS